MSYGYNPYPQHDEQYPPTQQQISMPLEDITPDYAADSAPTYVPEQYSGVETRDNENDNSGSSHSTGFCSIFGRAIEYFSKWYRIVGLIVTLFFFFYMVCLFSIYCDEYNAAKNERNGTVVPIPASVPALHWVLCIVAVTLGVFLILANSVLHWAFSVVACVLFGIFWIVNSVVVSQTAIYKTAENPISSTEYNNLTSKLSVGQPYSMIRIHGTYTTTSVYHSNGKRKTRTVTHHCYSPYVYLRASNWTDDCEFPNVNSTENELNFIDITKNIVWEDESNLRIIYLLDQYLSAMKSKGSRSRTWRKERIDTVNGYVESVVVSDEKLKGIISHASQIALSIFWAPAAFIYKLAADSFYMKGNMTKTDCVMTEMPSFAGYSMSC
ncbi:hypothetical protein GPJ56_000850 [Histomonas meleagridis]|uniref:uncharacterized protein n=1 Tax=Histomonas meleagridis TaxID=135588 RepID=UPI00355AC953|nr:hypothetical protein GPJ56_000850 [Histomonas meleagridis]KAH0801318.1 hypothetical protein GO595_005913 [Histomonas meleagridis]